MSFTNNFNVSSLTGRTINIKKVELTDILGAWVELTLQINFSIKNKCLK